MELFEWLENVINEVLNWAGVFAPILACLLILIESILPLLPLALFITVNFYFMGTLIGFIVSWVLTSIGCYISFRLCRNKLKKHFDNMLDKTEKKKLINLRKKIDNFSFSALVVLIAIPFTPAFMVNIAAGLSNMDVKKFIAAILIGKICLVYFWGFIGTSLLDSVSNPKVLIEIGILLIVAFILSKTFNKKFNLE